ncbi:MAG TPA: tRNA uracil 4-sulfurtransferase ThiI [Thermoleophilaceae bacterium]|nr:tRNA uracil 4-sulfurtransferase ThiI [Thermoleophilaceae bacterium]
METVGERCVLLKFGELALKGRNRPLFVNALERNLRRATSDLGPLEVRHRGGVLIVTGGMPEDALVERCLALPGVSVVQPALRCERDAAAGADAAVALLSGRPGRTFAIRSTRRDKSFPLRSMDLSRVIGDAVRVRLGLDVDLSNPDLVAHVEVDSKELLVSAERLRGAGGLPVGSSGRALVLLSGGLDSPVAAYRMMKRGLRCDFVHFSGRPFTGPESVYKAYALAGRLDRFQGDSRLFVVSFGNAQRRLASAGAGRLQVLSQRRLMVKVASELGRRERAEALVTGDSLGQVASQTLPNLALVEDAAELPLLRPLIDRDKSEIVEIAKQLGTYEISILPDEDCCQLFSSKLAVTRGQTDEMRRLERTADIEEMVDGLVDSAELHHPRLEREQALAPA